MVKRFISMIVFLAVIAAVYSQQKIQIFTGMGMKYRLVENSGANPGMNGAAVELGITRKTRFPFSLSGSLELGAGGVSNYLSLNFGFEHSFSLGKGPWEITPGIHVIQGLGLTRPKVLYMWGLEEKNFLAYRFRSGSALGLIIGFRLYAFPGYSEYSSVYRFLDLNMGIAFRFK